MSLLRFVARSMLASYFVVNGVQALIKPAEHTELAEPALALAPKLREALPEAARSYVPTDAVSMTRCLAAAQVAGGLSLATGIGRRVGAAVLAATITPSVIVAKPWRQSVDKAQLGTDVALLGGVLLAAADTEGKPSLSWRVREQRRLAAEQKANLEQAAKQAAGKVRRALEVRS
jgi:Predicted membrane protein